jgi:hypothetical protein
MKTKLVFFEINSYKLRDWYSYIIKFFTYTSNLSRNNFLCTHVGFVVEGYLYEATEYGVIKREYDYTRELKTYKIKEFEVEISEEGIEFLKKQLSCNYSYIGALLCVHLKKYPIIIKLIADLIQNAIRLYNKNNKNGWFCSQLTIAILLLYSDQKKDIKKTLFDFLSKKYGKHPILKKHTLFRFATNEDLSVYEISEHILPADIYNVFENILEVKMYDS